LFSLSGVSTVLTNHWTVKPENALAIFEKTFFTAMSDQIYLGAALKQYWDGYYAQTADLADDAAEKKEYKATALPLYRHNPCLYGVPLVRFV
jgi:hypothetical protein